MCFCIHRFYKHSVYSIQHGKSCCKLYENCCKRSRNIYICKKKEYYNLVFMIMSIDYSVFEIVNCLSYILKGKLNFVSAFGKKNFNFGGIIWEESLFGENTFNSHLVSPSKSGPIYSQSNLSK